MKTVPTWVGQKTHEWKAQIGGGSWYQAQNILKRVADVMKEYPKPVLVGLRGDVRDPYRFDLDTWDPNAETHGYWPDRAAAEHTLKIFEGKNCEFIWSMPTPNKFAVNPWKDAPKGSAYPWQTAAYYAAYLQYLIGMPNPHSGMIQRMKKTSYPFFTDASCTKINEQSNMEVGNNWANLRAKRGRVKPYPIQAVILGIEPYGDAQETMQVYGADSGALYGDVVLKFRNAIRSRGMTRIPLGLNIAGFYPMSDFQRPWFKPLFDKLGSLKSDFSYLDMHHHYHYGLPSSEINRIYPGLINTTPLGGAVQSAGWQNWHVPKSQWPAGVDYSRYMWMWEDIRAALKQIGENPSRWKIGCSEHGMAVKSPFLGNDMGAALHWALWLAECMRCDVQWDMNWVLSDMGNSHAQIQVRDGKVTRTPGHYVYKLAQQVIGLEHMANSFVSPTATEGFEEGGRYRSDDVVVRTFRKPNNGHYSLFVINKGTQGAQIKGWEKWQITNWRMLKGDKYESMNPIGDPWHEETVKTVSPYFVNGQPLTIPPISVNLVEMA